MEYDRCNYNEPYPIGYSIYYSDEIKTLLEFLSIRYNIYGKCPHCNKSGSMSVSVHSPIEEKLLSDPIWGYAEDSWEDDDFVDLKEYKIKQLLSTITKSHKFINKYYSCPICNEIYNTSYTLKFIDDKLILIKTGQYPSLRDFNENYTNRFSKDLKKFGLSTEYHEALVTHDEGHSVAAYVYMRRVIEQLILQKFNTKEDHIPTEDFNSMHLNEKIEYLREDLPDLLKDKKIYSLCSAGIHMLSAEECETYFPILQQSVELILIDEAKKQKEAALRKQLSIDLEKANHSIKKKIESN